jgi:hypothetical protein
MKAFFRMPWSFLGSGMLCVMILGACSTPLSDSDSNKIDSAGVNSELIRSLQRQIRERDRRIEELTSQLDAIKVIDQDIAKRRKSARPPVTLTPIE